MVWEIENVGFTKVTFCGMVWEIENVGFANVTFFWLAWELEIGECANKEVVQEHPPVPPLVYLN
ncbi:hypothetical protein KCTCHS21_43960 [Cohnella abietis]|uniref:Uncharacterized protein n=1 Tax=Cohnella abietis TaxID=2507935 RepID=A0A3T1DA63_9BACL|nr:hypothetical protein KCTCHS21_43960 [Cohnella abietis]